MAVEQAPNTDLTGSGYLVALAEGRRIYPGLRVGQPGRARSYWPVVAALRVLRLRWVVRVSGADQVAPGAGIIVANHVSAFDPVAVVMSTWWRVTAFTKVEAFQSRGGFFFRLMGQIPLRRGDPGAARWALGMARRALADGGKIGIYPESTRSPNPAVLHRLHKGVLVPLLQMNPDVPVHALTTTYTHRGWRRTQVQVRVSSRLPLDPARMGAEELTDVVRDALLALGGQTYIDRYAGEVKRSQPRPS